MSLTARLSDLGYRPFKPGDPRPATYSAASITGRRVPEDYEAFLEVFPRTGIFDIGVVFRGEQPSPWASQGLEALEVLFACCSDARNDLERVQERYRDDLGRDVLAIGEVTGANLVALRLDEDRFGEVCIWDHEHVGPPENAFHRIAGDFTSFIERLEPGELKAAEPAPTLIQSRMSPSLRARAAELLRKKP